MLDIEKSLFKKKPKLADKVGSKTIIKCLKAITHEAEINHFILQNKHLKGFSFLDQVLNHFHFSYKINAHALNRIPAEGRLLIVANHPIGSLDGLALLKMVSCIRPDVRIVASDLLNHIEPLKSLFLSVDNLNEKATHKSQLKAIQQALNNDEAVIIFPSGEVSRIRPNGVRDSKWKTGFIKLAQKSNTPILPIYIDARNSTLFYCLSALFKPLGTLLLVQEMFNKSHQEITFHIGKPIPWCNIEKLNFSNKTLANRFRKHLYRLDKENKKNSKLKSSLFETIETIRHPANAKLIKKALKKSQLLGRTQDGKRIYLYDYEADSPVMLEIGRLREFTFRVVGEGTGTAIDLDKYDTQYRHLVLWDDEELEIVGAYRIGECQELIKEQGVETLYSSTLFDLQPEMESYLPYAIELGRSFVQPKYWGKRSLDYLWYGIGAYVAQHPHIKYLFGPVSLSNAYPQNAKELIIGFYQQQLGSQQDLAVAKRPVTLSKKNQNISKTLFTDDYRTSYKKLNALLDIEGVKVPTLFKQYAELCEEKGCRFIDFSIDPEFGDCIDSLILVELDKIKPKKKERYLTPIGM